jgi:hypothetical protein
MPLNPKLNTFYLSVTRDGHSGVPMRFDVKAYFATEEERDAAIAAAPKAFQLRPSIAGMGDGTWYYVAGSYGNLLPNTVNGGINEAALKRFRRFLNIGEYWATDPNIHYLTLEEALAALSGQITL